MGDAYGMLACMHAELLQSCLTLCNPMYHSPPGSSVHRILPGKNTGVGCHDPPGDLPDPGIKTMSVIFLALAGRFLTTNTLGMLETYINEAREIWELSAHDDTESHRLDH